MHRKAAVLLSLLLAPPAWGQKVTLPAAVTTDPGVPAPVVAQADGANCVWVCPDPGITAIDGAFFGGDSKRAMIFGAKPGKYRLWAFTARGDKVSERAECLVTVGTPPPVPPVPPGPDPPDPPVPPGDNPFPADGKARALILFDNTQPEDMPAGLWNQVYGATFRGYLRDKTANQFRIWPKDVDGSQAEPEWQGALKKKFDKLPWIHLSNGKTGYSGPLPATRDETMKLMQKYGL